MHLKIFSCTLEVYSIIMFTSIYSKDYYITLFFFNHEYSNQFTHTSTNFQGPEITHYLNL